MLRAYSQKQRRFTRSHKSSPMMKQDMVQLKSLHRGIGNDSHLMLGHVLVSFVIDPFDFAAAFQFPHYSKKIDHRSSRKIDIFFGRFQTRFSQQNLRNGVCHVFESTVTM